MIKVTRVNRSNRKMNIKCVRCDDDMQTVFYEGVTIQLCMSCKGIFLSKRKLELIEESREIDIPKNTPKPKRKFEVLRNCPQCHTTMRKVKHGRIRATMIDYCEECQGIWLDKGEIASIQLGYETAQHNIMRNQLLRAS